eukprot:scaffold131935_cov39-Attheya_sp.AAC.1
MAAPERREWVPTSSGLKPSVASPKTAAAAQIRRRTSSLARWVNCFVVGSYIRFTGDSGPVPG